MRVRLSAAVTTVSLVFFIVFSVLVLLKSGAVAGPQKVFTNPLGMKFVLIPAGTFMMGSPPNELARDVDEVYHKVTISKPFYMQTMEVTQVQWSAVMGRNPSYFRGCGADCPVEGVSWDDAQEFIKRLKHLGIGDRYRLPTEAEWEYACRAGSTTALANGDITNGVCGPDPNLDAMGWYCGNAKDAPHRVGQKEPNAWGLYDMHGNVWEWCQDLVGYYPSEHVIDPKGPLSGPLRSRRGGSWIDTATRCRSANRFFDRPEARKGLIGFRLAMDPPGLSLHGTSSDQSQASTEKTNAH